MDLSNTNILLVDDEKDAISYMARALERRGAKVRMAFSGVEALKKLAEELADICLVDMRMPGMDGMELLKAIKHDYPSIEVVIVTGYANADIAAEVTRRGAFGLIPKPIAHEELFSCLNKIRTIQKLGEKK